MGKTIGNAIEKIEEYRGSLPILEERLAAINDLRREIASGVIAEDPVYIMIDSHLTDSIELLNRRKQLYQHTISKAEASTNLRAFDMEAILSRAKMELNYVEPEIAD